LHEFKSDLLSDEGRFSHTEEAKSDRKVEKTAELLPRVHFSGEHVGIFRASIARRPNDNRFAESGGSKFRKEGTALLGSGDSSEPILFAGLNLCG
jgi:hypothetical protein